MSSNILITGAAGYIGGSILADFLARKTTSIDVDRLIAAVRSEDQADSLSNLGIRVIQLDLTDEDTVVKTVLSHNISIVIHTASSINPSLALHLITALSKQGETSGLGAFFENTGWPAGPFKDTDAVFDTEKKLADSSPLRKTDVAVIEHAETRGVGCFVVVPSLVYGKGSGEWNKLSVVLPVYVNASISGQAVYKFPEDTKVSSVHISDLTALYGRIIENILQGEPLPTGREGYYFALAHYLHLGEVLDHLAIQLKARGLITDSKTKVYLNDEAAASSLGIPVPFVRPLWNSGDNIIAEIPHKIGWRPMWNKERFLQNIDDEIQAVVEHGKAKSSLIDSLFEFAEGEQDKD
ncbi:hypothetical protein PENPOL_c023G10563 [Penicillium polonicum]|uniref:NAD-dependent epimerase/dehydratase domain-containing protein n=1 Tax=Penicillium polonicum TaxID=60169 RepID=A0A1V6N7R8_PENPO|nr:hypothetical protein PENPOL_c023G10563 [Penicillium polonicum]